MVPSSSTTAKDFNRNVDRFDGVDQSAFELSRAEDAARSMPRVRSCSVLGMRVDELSHALVESQIRSWCEDTKARYMCISTVHMVMETHDNRDFRAVVNSADLVGADGMPIIWISRLMGLTNQERVFAPDLLIRLCELASHEGIPVGFYGSTRKVIASIVRNVTLRFPSLKVAFKYSPPFRPMTAEEAADTVDRINQSGVRILFVGLGCPRQERWMNDHRSLLHCVMIGVGWAFDVVAGHSKTAPVWIQKSGMEWFYRLVLNPKKLWRRHLKNNPRFLLFLALQIAGLKRFGVRAKA
jgi:N-acetylglucosaminyldiphosphoundecaprenol N-acetyl-beta-D-mannosaminyltransferase